MYAPQAGDFVPDLRVNCNPSSNAEWAGALEARSAAVRLGSYAPETFHPLAITEEQLGDHFDAVGAARRGLELVDPSDPGSKALRQLWRASRGERNGRCHGGHEEALGLSTQG
jgi:hypothetical protein